MQFLFSWNLESLFYVVQLQIRESRTLKSFMQEVDWTQPGLPISDTNLSRDIFSFFSVTFPRSSFLLHKGLSDQVHERPTDRASFNSRAFLAAFTKSVPTSGIHFSPKLQKYLHVRHSRMNFLKGKFDPFLLVVHKKRKSNQPELS